MELKVFVSQSIIALIDGVIDAKTYAKEHGARVNPNIAIANYGNNRAQNIIMDAANRSLQLVEFDVAVSVGETDAVQGDAKAGIHLGVASIQVLGISSELHGKQSAENFSVSRLRFSIPVELPKS